MSPDNHVIAPKVPRNKQITLMLTYLLRLSYDWPSPMENFELTPADLGLCCHLSILSIFTLFLGCICKLLEET